MIAKAPVPATSGTCIPRPAGINLVGYLRTESGMGTAARRYLPALGSLGLPLSLWDVSELQGNRSLDRTALALNQAAPYDLSLLCADVELYHTLAAHLGDSFFDSGYRVGLWAWELPRFPAKWADRFAYVDEIWVGSSYIANALAPVSPVPVVRIPPVLTPAAKGSREAGRKRLNARANEFLFLLVFDFHSHAERKNPLAVAEAFRQAFSADAPARLIVKCVNAEKKPAELAQLSERLRGCRASLVSGYWPSEEILDLMAACDSYVSLHRAEGIGLTVTDALALGKPVIATGWSGNMDYMNVNNSFPVEYELKPIANNVGPYTAGQVWAEPSIDHASALMRLVFQQREVAACRGRQAQRDMEATFSQGAVAELIHQRLEAIRVARRQRSFRRKIFARRRRYRRLPTRLAAVVRNRLPADATVLIVSKGDDRLLDLDGRPAWHFPRDADGRYAGFYPENSKAAIDHLENLRTEGAQYLLLPSTAFWWLDHYAGLRRHLESRYRSLPDTGPCRIYQLDREGENGIG